MDKLIIFLAASALALCLPAAAQDRPEKIIIIKADDIRRVTDGWNRFFELSKAKNVKVSAGIICCSLETENSEYCDWLRAQQASGMVEFWNHGWDHKRWTNEQNERVWEFRGSGYDHQKKHFSDSQNIMEKVLGSPPAVFGAPYNAIDSDTLRVMNEDENMRLFFGYEQEVLNHTMIARMHLRGENDGTGKPNFEIFKETYMQKPDLTFTVLQFHPNNFDDERLAEYGKIIDFLIAEGWTFMLPAEYISMIDQAERASS